MKNWNELSITDKNDIIKVAVQNGITTLPEIRSKYNEFAEGGPKEVLERINSSNADFVQRLKDPNRQTIEDWEVPGNVATHKLAIGQDEEGNTYIYPMVQKSESTGKIVDFSRPPYADWVAEGAAIDNNDTVRINNLDDAIWFTENYKKYYPNFEIYERPIWFSSGGSIHIKPENRGKFTALKKRTGHSASWFKAHGTPAQRKMATFELNARKWKHGDGGHLYDGESENTQQMYTGFDWWNRAPMTDYEDVIYEPLPANAPKSKGTSLLDTPIMVQTTPTASTAATFGQYMPEYESTPKRELITLGATIAAPFLPSVGQYGLQAMNTAFTPSTWLNPVTGAKLLSPAAGTIADAGVQGAFAYEGLNGLWNQGRQGTLLSDPASTLMHVLEVIPMIGVGANTARNIANQAKAADIANTAQAAVKPFNSEDLFYQNLFNHSKNLYSRYGRFLGNYYKNKINTITDPVLKHIVETSPQYIDEVLAQQAKGGATEDFVKGLIQRANNYRRYLDKPLSAEDFATFRGGFAKTKGNGTINVEGMQRSMDYGNYPAYYQGQPTLEGSMETWWDQRIPKEVNTEVGMHSRINPVIQEHVKRLHHSANLSPDYEMYVFGNGNDDLYSAFWDGFRSTGAPDKTILWPVHQVFEAPYGTKLPNFNITVGKMPSGFYWGKGYKYGGPLVEYAMGGRLRY